MNDHKQYSTLADSNVFNLNSGNFSPIVVRTPLTGTDSYYRSLTFTSSAGANPLIAAASALLTINTRLKQCIDYKNTGLLYEHLVHEIKAFETKAQNLGYRTETILVARYILCATLDETIMNLSFGKEHQWQQQLLGTFQNEENAGERFFLILERISEDPNHHIDLLELIYLCISLGYEGQYKELHNGKAKLDNIIDILYQHIRKQRQELKPLLTYKIATTVKSALDNARPISINKKFSKYFLLGGFLLISLYLGIDLLLVQTNKETANEFQTISKTLANFHDNT